MGPYDPRHRLKDTAKAIGEVAEHLASGLAECDRPADVANTLEQLRLLVGGVSEVLRQQAGALPEMTSDRDAPAAGRLIEEAAAAAANLGEQLRGAGEAVRNVR
jgi:ABC-type transporter Mla subunit MlaD